MKYITIESKEGDRRSTLVDQVDHLEVLGNLPHCYKFRPATPADRNALVDFLKRLEY